MRVAMSQSIDQPIPAEIYPSIVVKRIHFIYKTIQYLKCFTGPFYIKNYKCINIILGKG